jgi:hypothetical protein
VNVIQPGNIDTDMNPATSVDIAGLNHVHRDALGPQVAGPAAGVGRDGGLGGHVVGNAGKGGPAAAGRPDGDDAPALPYKGHGGPHGGGDARHIDGQLPVEGGQVGGRIVDGARDKQARVVYQHINAPELHHGVGDGRPNSRGIAAVGPDGQRPAARPRQLGYQGFGLGRGVGVGEGYVGTFGGQPAHNAGPNPAAATRYKSDFIG